MSAEILDTATPYLQLVTSKLQHPRALLAVAGRVVTNKLHEHFLARDAEGNAQGWPRSHFWNRVVKRATSFVGATDLEATVSIASEEFLHKLHGGTITAKSGKMLAIPLTPEAKAKGSPREWDDPKALFVLKGVSQLFLARKGDGSGHGKSGGSGVELLYVLKHSVNQAADPRALPEPGVLESAVEQAAHRFVERSVA